MHRKERKDDPRAPFSGGGERGARSLVSVFGPIIRRPGSGLRGLVKLAPTTPSQKNQKKIGPPPVGRPSEKRDRTATPATRPAENATQTKRNETNRFTLIANTRTNRTRIITIVDRRKSRGFNYPGWGGRTIEITPQNVRLKVGMPGVRGSVTGKRKSAPRDDRNGSPKRIYRGGCYRDSKEKERKSRNVCVLKRNIFPRFGPPSTKYNIIVQNE